MIPWWVIAVSFLLAVGCAYLLWAWLLAGQFGRMPAPGDLNLFPGVTILKPLYGDEPGLFENLASFCDQRYRGPVQIVCGVQNDNDPAIKTIEYLRRKYPASSIELVIDATPHGANGKIANLINMAPHIEHDVVVLADSDIRVEPDYLNNVIAALCAPGVGAVTCLYRGLSMDGLWSRLFAMYGEVQFLPSVLVGLALGRARPCFGSTIAMRGETLAAIGGFAAFADVHGDDYAIGQAIRAYGLQVTIPGFLVTHVNGPMSLRDVWHHELRWARNIRSLDPLGHAGSAIAHPLAWGILGAVLGGTLEVITWAWGLALVMAPAAIRLALVHRIGRSFGFRPQSYWLVPIRDLLSFAVFVTSFFSRRVVWRGGHFKDFGDGKLLPEGRSPKP